MVRVEAAMEPFWEWLGQKYDRELRARQERINAKPVNLLQEIADALHWPVLGPAMQRGMPVEYVIWLLAQRVSSPEVPDADTLDWKGADWWLNGWASCVDGMIFALRGWVAYRDGIGVEECDEL